MYRLKGFFKGKEYQLLAYSLSSAVNTLKRSKAKADSIFISDEGGEIQVYYIKGLGIDFNPRPPPG